MTKIARRMNDKLERKKTKNIDLILNTFEKVPAALEKIPQFPDIAGCSFCDTLGVSWKLCQ